MYNIVLSLLIIINSFYASGSIENKLDHTLPTILSEKENFNPTSLIQPLPNKTESETLEYMISQIGNNKWPVLVFDCYDFKKNGPEKIYFKKNVELETICDGLSWIAQQVKQRYPNNNFAQIFITHCFKSQELVAKLFMRGVYLKIFNSETKNDPEQIYNNFILSTQPKINEPLQTFEKKINAYYKKNFTNTIRILDENISILKQSCDKFFSTKAPDLEIVNAQSTQKEKLEQLEKNYQEYIAQVENQISQTHILTNNLEQSLAKNIERIIVQDTINNDSQKINPKKHLFRLLKICTWLSISAILIQIYFWTY